MLSERQRARLRRHLLALLENDEWLTIDALSQHTGFLIARAHRQVRGWAVEELRPLDIRPRDFGVLAVLGQEQPCSQKHLAKALGVTPSAALAFIEELEAAGLLTRQRNAADRRFYDVTLTPAGHERLQQAVLAASAVQSRVRSRLGDRGDAELRRLLADVISG
jgi:DNA-binding MarR family transcriptional regulator